MEQISFTIPMEGRTLRSTAKMLVELAESLRPKPKHVETFGEEITREVAELENELSYAEACMRDDLQEIQMASNEENVADIFANIPVPTMAAPAPAPAPTMEAAAPAPTTSTVALDKDGLPWDERIHSGAKTMTAKGVWKKLRGVAPELVTHVEAELRAMAAPAPTPTMAAPAPTMAAPAPTPTPTPTMAAPAPAPAPSSAVANFPQLLKAITANGISKEAVQAVVGEYGFSTVNLVGSRPDLIPEIAAKLGL